MSFASTISAGMGSASAMGRASVAMGRSMTSLSTGHRINRASDDPAGLIAASHLDADRVRASALARGRDRAVLHANIEDGRLAAQPPSGATAVARAEIGAAQRGDEALARVHERQAIETAAALSATRDTDYAAATSDLSRASVLYRASMAARRVALDQSWHRVDLLG